MGLDQDRRRIGEMTAVLILAALVVIGWSALSGAFDADLGDDEASHIVSSLFLLDALRFASGGALPQPLTLLRDFHGHYPMVGIGHWPPFYYGVAAFWMAATSATRAALLVLSGLVAAAIAMRLYTIVARRNGRVAGGCAAVVFIVCPLVREATGEVMLDLPVALLCLLAADAYARYLATSRMLFAVLFGAVASAALLTKGTAVCLVLLPPIIVIVTGRWALLRRPSFWLPAVMAGAVAVPWYALTYHLVSPGFRHTWGLAYTQAAILENGTILLTSVGPLLLLAAGVSLVRWIMKPTQADPERAAMAALLVAVLVFQCIVPAALEPRYLLPAVPPLLIIASDGIAALVSRVGRRWMAAGVLTISLIPILLTGPKIAQHGIAQAAQAVWDNLPAGNSTVLIAADSGIEPAVVAELALRDPSRPSLFAIRGSRLLGGGGYNNGDYAPRFTRLEDVGAAIDSYGIGLVLLRSEGRPNAWAHVLQVAQLAVLRPRVWEPVWRGSTGAVPVTLYRVTPNLDQPADAARLIALSAPRALAAR